MTTIINHTCGESERYLLALPRHEDGLGPALVLQSVACALAAHSFPNDRTASIADSIAARKRG